ncbi:MAG: helix-turn-helix transcriptional regulator [Chloroflexi bacterium]|nr:helix-turn-helix transcriptional regulator [Chloroflexota bacterium]
MRDGPFAFAAGLCLGALCAAFLARGGEARAPATKPDGLTDRQRQILECVAEGLTSKEIATRHGLAESTVRTHIRRSCEVLGAPNRAAAIALLRRAQMEGEPPRPSRSAMPDSAATTSPTRSSNGTPSASAPDVSISRLIARANALSFIFLRTLSAVTLETRLSGRTSATAVTKPASSSTA